MRGKLVDDRPAGISQPQQLCDFVESFSGSVIAGVSDVLIGPTVVFPLCQIKMGVAARDDQRQHGETQIIVISLLTFLEQDGMNVTFEMVHRDQRLVESEGQRLGIADADQQRAGQSGPLGDGQRVDGLVSLSGIGQRLADDRHDRAQMLPRRQFGHDSAVRLVRGDLREHNVGNDLLTRAHYGRRGLVARAFNPEDVGVRP